MTTLVTSVAGFIGSEVAKALLAAGEEVAGIDNLNDYYSVQLKRDRLAGLDGRNGFAFLDGDIAEMADLEAPTALGRPRRVIHLAAQAGVRYSLTNPGAYIRSNLVGHANVLEFCRHLEGLRVPAPDGDFGGDTEVRRLAPRLSWLVKLPDLE